MIPSEVSSPVTLTGATGAPLKVKKIIITMKMVIIGASAAGTKNVPEVASISPPEATLIGREAVVVQQMISELLTKEIITTEELITTNK